MSRGRTPAAVANVRKKAAAELIAAGHTPKEIAAQIGLTEGRVHRIVSACGFRPLYVSEQERNYIGTLRVTGGAAL